MKPDKTIKNDKKQIQRHQLLSEERKQLIIDKLDEYGIVRVSDLSAQMNTTEATIRRDLDDLQAKGIAIRVHGGAKSVTSTGKKMTLQENLSKCEEEREKIAQIAYRFLEERDCIVLDTSATVQSLARLLLRRPVKDLTIITPSFDILHELAQETSYTLIFVGGKYNWRLNSTAGILAQNVLENIHVDKAFIGSPGVDAAYGFSGPYEEETQVKMRFVSNSNHQFILADHTKFFRTYLYRFAAPKEIEYVITDRKPDWDILETFKAKGVNVIYE